MKNIFASSLAFVIVCCLTAFRPLPVPFEGNIHVETAVSGEVPQAVKDRLGASYDLSFRKNELKIRGTAPLKGEIIVKRDVQKMYIVRLDHKSVYEVDLNDKRIPENTSKPVVTSSKERMTIAGYPCQKYEIQYGNDMKLFVWTTSAIQADNWSDAIFGGLKLSDGVIGFPLRLQLVSSKFTVTCTATVVQAMEMNAMEFALPAGLAMQKL